MKLKWVETNIGEWVLRTDYVQIAIVLFVGTQRWAWVMSQNSYTESGHATTQRAAKINARRAYNRWRQAKDKH